MAQRQNVIFICTSICWPLFSAQIGLGLHNCTCGNSPDTNISSHFTSFNNKLAKLRCDRQLSFEWKKFEPSKLLQWQFLWPFFGLAQTSLGLPRALVNFSPLCHFKPWPFLCTCGNSPDTNNNLQYEISFDKYHIYQFTKETNDLNEKELLI